jgi:hypothetical protein
MLNKWVGGCKSSLLGWCHLVGFEEIQGRMIVVGFKGWVSLIVFFVGLIMGFEEIEGRGFLGFKDG